MKIYVVGSSKNKFLQLNDIREKFFVDMQHKGDNIDHLNPWYCELTGLYYLWKNCKDDIVGLEHYRRYFADNGKLYSKEKIEKILSEYDIICDISKTTPMVKDGLTIAKDLSYFTKSFTLNKIEIYIKTFHPEMSSYFDEYINQKTKNSYNMFIGKKCLIDKYCDWIFNMLNDITKFEPLNKRDCGYIAEFMFSFFIRYNNWKVFETNIFKTMPCA